MQIGGCAKITKNEKQRHENKRVATFDRSKAFISIMIVATEDDMDSTVCDQSSVRVKPFIQFSTKMI